MNKFANNSIIAIVTLGLGAWLVASQSGFWFVVGCLLLARVAWILIALHGIVILLSRALANEIKNKRAEVTDETRGSSNS